MALYARFYVKYMTDASGEGLGSESGDVVTGMGDRAVIQLDMRERQEAHHQRARDWIRRHESSQRFIAYRLFTGSILDPDYITPVLRPDGTEVPLSAVHDYAPADDQDAAEAAVDWEAVHDAASARIESVPDANGGALVIGSHVTGPRDVTGDVKRFDTRGQDPTGPLDTARVTIWVSDTEGREFAFRGRDLQIAPTGPGGKVAAMKSTTAQGRSRASTRSSPGATAARGKHP
jgi:hypothetical protein